MKSSISVAQTLGLYVLLSCSHISLALAHGDDGGDGMNMDNNAVDEKEGLEDGDPSYFWLERHVGMIYTHIVLMVIAWVIVLPVAVMLSIASSRYTLLSQIVFTAFNALGMMTAVFYNATTPDLYPNNAHHKIGWIISAVTLAHVFVGVISRGRGTSKSTGIGSSQERQSFMSLPMSPDTLRGSDDESPEYRLSSDSLDREDPLDSLRPGMGGMSNDTTPMEDGDDEPEMPAHKPHRRFLPVTNFLNSPRWRLASRSPWTYLGYAYKATDRIILPFAFVAITTGIVTFGRFFEGSDLLNGLAHWIKGGVFFWLGLFTLGRWAGSFADLGWAWNIRPRRPGQRRTPPSAEFVESFLIFLYGATNIFLERLSNKDGKWKARDLEHISITVLFIGGGLSGMLVESTRVRDLLSTIVQMSSSADAYDPDSDKTEKQQQQLRTPPSYGFSLNPMPGLVICLLGSIMSSHHQSSMTSTMVHKQWGQLLLGASVARVLTYILMYLRPPTSVLPSRPPTELLASFGLISGGIIFMASSRSTVDAMIRNDLDAMFLYTVTMGLVGILMAWEVVVLALKGLASRVEERYAFKR